MSWQVEQLKEELSSKEAQGEELKKRAAVLQAEVFAVRFTSLCAVVPWWALLALASGWLTLFYGWQLCPILALTSLFCCLTSSSCLPVCPTCQLCVPWPSCVLEALYLALYCCFCNGCYFKPCFFESIINRNRYLLIYMNVGCLFLDTEICRCIRPITQSLFEFEILKYFTHECRCYFLKF